VFFNRASARITITNCQGSAQLGNWYQSVTHIYTEALRNSGTGIKFHSGICPKLNYHFIRHKKMGRQKATQCGVVCYDLRFTCFSSDCSAMTVSGISQMLLSSSPISASILAMDVTCSMMRSCASRFTTSR